MYNRKIVHYVADDAKKRVNAAFLIGAYSVCLSMCLLIRQTRRNLCGFGHVLEMTKIDGTIEGAFPKMT